MQLATLTELKILLEKEDTAQDELLSLILSNVSSRIQSYLNRGLVKAQCTDLYNGGRLKYYVKNFPIEASSPLTITVDGVAKTLTTDYKVWYTEGLIEFLVEPTTEKPQTVSITYTGGFPLATTGENETDIVVVPDDIKYACIQQAAYDFRNRDQLGITRVQMQVSGGNEIIKTASTGDLLPGIKKILRPYRRFPVLL